jgi:hypothetical protein
MKYICTTGIKSSSIRYIDYLDCNSEQEAKAVSTHKACNIYLKFMSKYNLPNFNDFLSEISESNPYFSDADVIRSATDQWLAFIYNEISVSVRPLYDYVS